MPGPAGATGRAAGPDSLAAWLRGSEGSEAAPPPGDGVSPGRRGSLQVGPGKAGPSIMTSADRLRPEKKKWLTKMKIQRNKQTGGVRSSLHFLFIFSACL